MREKEKRRTGEQQTKARAFPQKQEERAALRRRGGMARKHFSPQPQKRAHEQRVGNALQRSNGKSGHGENAHAELRYPHSKQYGERHVCRRAHAAGNAVIDGGFVMLKVGAELEIERVYCERERQQQRIAESRNDAARREIQQKKKERRHKHQHRPEHVRRIEARGGIHKRGEPRAEQKAENASEREQAAKLRVAVAECAEINGGKAAGKTVAHPKSGLIEREKCRDTFCTHGAHPFAVGDDTVPIIHKGHAGVKSEYLYEKRTPAAKTLRRAKDL